MSPFEKVSFHVIVDTEPSSPSLPRRTPMKAPASHIHVLIKHPPGMPYTTMPSCRILLESVTIKPAAPSPMDSSPVQIGLRK